MSSTDQNTETLLKSRESVYGDRIDNMVRVAQMWSGFLGHEIQPWQVPVMFALYKVYRLGITPDYSDNIDDVDGYMQMFREVIGDDMVQARTVEEYLAKVNGPKNPEAEAEAEAMEEYKAQQDIIESMQREMDWERNTGQGGA